MAHSFREFLRGGGRIFFDGGLGTMLQAKGLPAGVSPEVHCLKRPEVLREIHSEYIMAGADVITTNTFGGTAFKLPDGLDVFDFNRRMAQAAREAANEAGRPVFVAGSVGPTGKFLRPLGDLDFSDLLKAFQDQIRGLVAGGADLVMIETQFDIAEARAAVVAARRECGLPVAVSMTYDAGLTLTGSSPEVCAATFANMGVDIIATNCSAGPEEMRDTALRLIKASPVPVLVQPNAGLPELVDMATVFRLGAEKFAGLTAEFGLAGARLLGGCCGTTPAHISALRNILDGVPFSSPARPDSGPAITLTSRSGLVRVGRGVPLRIIGERINPTGKKQLSAELQAGEFSLALRYADEQIAAGAPLLDVNCGAPMADETALLPDLVSRLSSRHPAPLAIDSANPEAVAKALEVYPASPLVNSISGEPGRLERLGPLCRDFGAPFILLPLQGKTLPVSAAERIAIIEDLLRQMDDLRIPRGLAIVDALVLSVSSNPEAALECLEVIRYCRERLGLPATVGLSNISFGLPARELVNSSFLTLAAGAGLAACIANPGSVRIQEALAASNLLCGRDEGAEAFIAGFAGWKPGEPGQSGGRIGGGAAPAASFGNPLADAVLAGRREEIVSLVEKALQEGLAPLTLVNERLIPAITEVGRRYERKEYFLPQLIRSAETMQAAFARLKPLLEESAGKADNRVIVMATVEGDIHDIGKNIVNLMLGNNGFTVVDLGKDVPARRIVEAAREHGAGVIGLSALMTTTMVRMEETVKLLKEENLPVKVMVGGAVVTDSFARGIGAHGYSKDAVEAVRVARRLFGEA